MKLLDSLLVYPDTRFKSFIYFQPCRVHIGMRHVFYDKLFNFHLIGKTYYIWFSDKKLRVDFNNSSFVKIDYDGEEHYIIREDVKKKLMKSYFWLYLILDKQDFIIDYVYNYHIDKQ